jgi:hypothetical protein
MINLSVPERQAYPSNEGSGSTRDERVKSHTTGIDQSHQLVVLEARTYSPERERELVIPNLIWVRVSG